MKIRPALFDERDRVIYGMTPWLTGILVEMRKQKVVAIGAGVYYHASAILIDSDDDQIRVIIPRSVCDVQRIGVAAVDEFIDHWRDRRIRLKGDVMLVEGRSILEQRTGKRSQVTIAVTRIAEILERS